MCRSIVQTQSQLCTSRCSSHMKTEDITVLKCFEGIKSSSCSHDGTLRPKHLRRPTFEPPAPLLAKGLLNTPTGIIYPDPTFRNESADCSSRVQISYIYISILALLTLFSAIRISLKTAQLLCLSSDSYVTFPAARSAESLLHPTSCLSTPNACITY